MNSSSTDSDSSTHSLSYRDSGVDIDAGNELVERIKPAIRRTQRDGCVGGIGGFGGLFELPLDRYPNPLLVSGTDGVGTKLKLAIDLQQYDTIGIDLVAMCANDIAVLGAEALYFLDYYATGKLSLEIAEQAIEMRLPPDQVLINCGGGGLSAGSAVALKARLQDVSVRTVEPDE